MGKEWYWSRPLRRREEDGDVRERPPQGCMSGMLQLLHFRQLLLFPSHTHHQQHDQHRRPAQATTIRAARNDSGHRGIRAKTTPDSGRGHQPFLTEANQDNTTASFRLAGPPAQTTAAAPVTAPEKTKTTWLIEDDGRSLQVETPRTSNVVARLMGLDELPARPDATPRRFHPSPAHVTLQPSPPPKPCRHDQKENDGGNKRQRRQGKVGCGADPPLPPGPVAWRKPLSVRNTNIILEMEGSRSLPGTPRLSSSSGRRSCDGETPRLSLQLHMPVMKEFDYLCEIVPESLQLQSAPRMPSKSASPTNKSGSKDTLRPQQPRDGKRRAAAGSGTSNTVPKQQAKDPGAGKGTGGHGCDGNRDSLVGRRRGHEKKKTCRSPSSASAPSCSELTAGENTLETKQVLAETVAVHKADVAVPKPVLSSSPPFLEYRVVARKKTSCRTAKPSADRFTEKLRRPPSEKAAAVVRSRSVASTRTSKTQLTVQSNIQPPPLPTPWLPSPLPRTPLVPPPTVRPTEELPREKLAAGFSPSLHGSTEWRRSSSSRRPDDDDDDEKCCHPEFRYVRMILECVDLLNNASHGRRPATLARWHSPSHPVDPTVFYRLELFLPDEEDELRQLGRLRHRCNRKLLFHLVEEILADLLRRSSLGVKYCWPSHFKAAGNMTAAVVMGKRDSGDALLRHLWSRIRRLRPALVDASGRDSGGPLREMRNVDALLVGIGLTDGDAVGRLNPLHDPAVREEVESIATVIEEGIFDFLMEELKGNC